MTGFQSQPFCQEEVISHVNTDLLSNELQPLRSLAGIKKKMPSWSVLSSSMTLSTGTLLQYTLTRPLPNKILKSNQAVRGTESSAERGGSVI